MIASGAPAEFGRTAGGVVNVITKSGTNQTHGSVFHFQRLEGLTGEHSDGSRSRISIASSSAARSAVRSGRTRRSISSPSRGSARTSSGRICAARSGHAVPGADADAGRERSADQRERRLPAARAAQLLSGDARPGRGPAGLAPDQQQRDPRQGRLDAAMPATTCRPPATSIIREGEPDVRRRHLRHLRQRHRGVRRRSTCCNVNLFTTLSSTRLNESHLTYSRETRPRTAAPSNLAADTGIGFAPSFRFGNPFFLQPNVDELVKRFQFKDNLTLVTGAHTIKAGGEWLHTNNDQVFRGFFKGRYLFDSVTGFLRYASPAAAGGFGPVHRRLLERLVRDGARQRARPARRRPAARCCSICRAAALTARARRGGRVGHQQRGAGALRAGQVAAARRPDDRLRPALGRAADAGDGRSERRPPMPPS